VIQRFIDDTEPATADAVRLRGMLRGDVAA
jgi:hypothetical protein